MTRRSTRSTPVLPGLSRSTACSTRTCQRLDGHKGEHRTTLHATTLPKAAVAKVAVTCPTCGHSEGVGVGTGAEVLSADRYTVQQPEPKAPKAPRAARSSRQLRCRVSRDGVRCGRAYGHKQAGKRHSFAGLRVLAEVAPKERPAVVRGKPSRRHNYVVSGKPSSRLA